MTLTHGTSSGEGGVDMTLTHSTSSGEGGRGGVDMTLTHGTSSGEGGRGGVDMTLTHGTSSGGGREGRGRHDPDTRPLYSRYVSSTHQTQLLRTSSIVDMDRCGPFSA